MRSKVEKRKQILEHQIEAIFQANLTLGDKYT